MRFPDGEMAQPNTGYACGSRTLGWCRVGTSSTMAEFSDEGSCAPLSLEAPVLCIYRDSVMTGRKGSSGSPLLDQDPPRKILLESLKVGQRGSFLFGGGGEGKGEQGGKVDKQRRRALTNSRNSCKTRKND
eukprot:RCo054623